MSQEIKRNEKSTTIDVPKAPACVGAGAAAPNAGAGVADDVDDATIFAK